MMKPRMIPVMITAAITAVVLFGGWAIYNQVAVAAPLEQVMNDIPGVVASEKPVMNREQVSIQLELAADADLKDVYQSIASNGKAVFGDRKLVLSFKNDKSKQIDELWNNSLFEVAEAMETSTYSNIPDAMNEAAKSLKDVTVTTALDETNVYITIKDTEAVKYVVLPRKSTQLEAW
ncbi:hypothetical protein BK133_13590 [Paenibacillus sp. FSL H8-0548]|uniref:hypothetical protein n=1 Tax=Paenibacillus sp. FSL H8-0548 TaxID=1920422 RepID=UPI00096C648E|nr:hypothetical protein [Paenibacillus sp. FSL H8-0548]OMF33817.1 hypothetical protein BK133_13590 [Paenibacillus sp. FSL H8-0548]